MTSRFLCAICVLVAQGFMFAQGELMGVDGVIALVQANMSEAFVMKRPRRKARPTI
jgi:hypothetical protein